MNKPKLFVTFWNRVVLRIYSEVRVD